MNPSHDAGEVLRVGAVGGSITAGQGVGGAKFTYVRHFMDWLNTALPPRPNGANAPDTADPYGGGGGGKGVGVDGGEADA